MNAPWSNDGKAPLLLVRGVTKRFGATQALTGADLTVNEREIHALLGADGSGKSTLARIIAGHVGFDDGEITYRNYPIRLRSTRDAIRIGIALVTQNTSLVPDMSVLENIFLPELGRPGFLNRMALRKRGEDLLTGLGQSGSIPLDTMASRLSASQRQIVEIAKAFSVRGKLIVFDEPTAALNAGEIDRLHDVMARLRLAGRGLLVLSHRSDEWLAIADRVTVMRQGRTVLHSRNPADLTPGDLARASRGTDPAAISTSPDRLRVTHAPSVVLEVAHMRAPPDVAEASFVLHRGEILGVGGLVGSGWSETARAIAGLRARPEGTVVIGGKTLRARNPHAAVEAGVVFLSGDGRRPGLVPDMTIRENLMFTASGSRRDPGNLGETLHGVAGRLGLPSGASLDALPATLPASLQRRVELARCLLLAPKVLVLEQPMRGIDGESRALIEAVLREEAGKGLAIVLASSHAEDLLGLADRIVLMSEGRTVTDQPRAVLDPERMRLLCSPRDAITRNTALLEALIEENGGAGFWALIDGETVICLNAVVPDAEADPGFRAGDARALGDTAIPNALRSRQPAFVSEGGTSPSTMLVPLKSSRGRDMGWVGLSLPFDHAMPPPEAIKFRVDSLAGKL